MAVHNKLTLSPSRETVELLIKVITGGPTGALWYIEHSYIYECLPYTNIVALSDIILPSSFVTIQR